jgi:AraC-like DNA-binding protein
MLRKKSGDLSLAGVACESGYFDQAHLIREMKNLSGLTPGQYLRPQNVLAANLIRLTH